MPGDSDTDADVQIRTADPGETAAVADLWVDLVTDQRRHGARLLATPNRAAMAETLARFAVDGRVRVAVDDGAVVGFVRHGVERGRLATDATRGVVHDLYVVPDRRREGIGAALLSAAETDLRDRGAAAVTVEALAGNAAARRFYERHGYRPHRIALEKPLRSAVESDKRPHGDR